MLKLFDYKGDTIIEVLFAMSVLALAFSISYATASSALTHAQNSQEHSLALEYMDYQLEALQYFSSQPGSLNTPVFNTTKDFCLQAAKPATPGASAVVASPLFSLPPVFSSSSAATIYPAMCQVQANGFSYFVAIQPDSSINNDFHVFIDWVGLGNLGTQSGELSYKVYP